MPIASFDRFFSALSRPSGARAPTLAAPEKPATRARLQHALVAWLLGTGLAVALFGPTAQAQSSLQQLLAAPSTAAVVSTPQARAELLVHAPQGIAPGQPVWLGLQIEHAPDWHTYWKNPGDSGLPTELQWTLPPGVSAGPIAWPTPTKFPLGELANYGYGGRLLLPVALKIGPEFVGDQLPVKLYATWLICRKECIPEEGEFLLQLPTQGVLTQHSAAFEAAQAAQPASNSGAQGSARPDGAFLTLQAEGLPTAWQGQTLEFFPELPGLIEPGAPWTQRWAGGQWRAQVPLSPHRSEGPSLLPAVLSWPSSGSPGVALELAVQGDWPAPAPLAAASAADLPPALQAALDQGQREAAANSANSAPPIGLLAALLGALVGGLILNLMPCVFPVLAIKVLAFAQPGHSAASHRLNGLAYSAGVVLSFMALGGLLLGLRAAGEQLGWGFQLQNPAVVAALALLFTLIGLNLAGLFEIGNLLPSGLATLRARRPGADAFLTGVLATAVASPCTAPFMGASLGLAVALPTGQALTVFAALGLGMAAPYLLASWVPAVARALPKPGAWMEQLRHFLAFPMFATVVWLVWVLGQQSGINGAAALLLLLLGVALLAWSLGLRGRGRLLLGGLSLASLLWMAWALGPQITQAAPSHSAQAPTGVAGLQWAAWSPEREAALLAEGRPVFVDYTAAWCVTCQYNKRTTLSNAEVLGDMATRGVALLRADWTRRDPQITAALGRLGRSGVPVYTLQRSGQAPQVLSELLSVDELRGALARL